MAVVKDDQLCLISSCAPECSLSFFKASLPPLHRFPFILAMSSYPPLHDYDYSNGFSKGSHETNGFPQTGWGIHAGRLPMYSPVWTNDKPWAQKLASQLSSSLAQIPRLVSQFIPSTTRRSARAYVTGRPSLTTSTPSSNFTFVLLCSLWYASSALSSNTGKAILIQFRYPITLTFVQFGFVAFYCILFMSPAIRFSKFRYPTMEIFKSTFPMGLFQVGGHIFSSIAISRIPVSTVHTIKVNRIPWHSTLSASF